MCVRFNSLVAISHFNFSTRVTVLFITELFLHEIVYIGAVGEAYIHNRQYLFIHTHKRTNEK